ncbi:hypothetical protein [Kordia jejudonensis]|uniref:hypothetical protein n=1 Tax=Kordia jejudonensis TaxID=1348245 RepID=UPI0006294B43|nr:hypothetical protein [Kordia jejudonensis]
MKLTSIIVIFLLFLSCKSQKITKPDYKLVNMVVDSLVNLAYYDSIGLKIETLNSRLSKERVLNSGFLYNKDGKYINQCPGNEIGDSLYKKFDYEEFISKPQTWDLKYIKNDYFISNFSLKTQRYKEKLEKLVNDNQSHLRKDMKEALWMNERGHIIHLISTPIYSDKKDIALVLVRKYFNGLQSWQLRKNTNGEWYIFCIKQIEFE